MWSDLLDGHRHVLQAAAIVAGTAAKVRAAETAAEAAVKVRVVDVKKEKAARGGMTSHAAVVARGMGKCCVSGAGALNIDYKARTVEIDGVLLKEGDFISLNGSTCENIIHW